MHIKGKMKKKKLARPNEEAMFRLLAKYANHVEEVILRLAWQAGLTRQEILDLKWSNIAAEDNIIHLSRRSIPIPDDLSMCLARRKLMCPIESEFSSKDSYVVFTDAYVKHPTKVHLSRLVAAAMEKEEELRNFRLDDLRNDFIIRLLEKEAKTYAMEIAGINRVAINNTFADYLPAESTGQNFNLYTSVDEEKLKKIIHAEGDSPVAIALLLVWELGLPLNDIADLTWEQIDFSRKELYLYTEAFPLSEDLIKILQEVFSKRAPDSDPHILLRSRSGKPIGCNWLSKLSRNALIRGGMSDINIVTIAGNLRIRKVFSFIQEHGAITTKQIIELLGVNKVTAGSLLRELVAQGKLVKNGTTRGVTYTLPRR